jgi:hypothetical protein
MFLLQHCGWKGWGEISFGGSLCKERAAAAEFLVCTLTLKGVNNYNLKKHCIIFFRARINMMLHSLDATRIEHDSWMPAASSDDNGLLRENEFDPIGG